MVRFFLFAFVMVVGGGAGSFRVSAQDWSPPRALTDLPATAELPDLFTLADGAQVHTLGDWRRRREELKQMLLYYQYGRMPGRPDQVVAVHSRRVPHPSGLGTMEWVTLQIDSERRLLFRAVFYLPQHGGRRPVIIREEDRLGQREEAALFLKKGYIFVEYARHDLDPDRDRVVGSAQAAYPNHDWATLSVWAWCGMRLVDYLETRPDVDRERIGITGHSRGGKMALLAAALDERIALVVPHQSGSGGAGCYRVMGPGAEALAHNDKPHWYHERLRWFGMQEERLPFDQHFLKALVAPRALLCTESIDDAFANPLGSLVTSAAAQKVYDFLGQPERNQVHFRRGGHTTEARDWELLLAFADWHFFGKEPEDKDIFWKAPLVVPEGYAYSPETAAGVEAEPPAEEFIAPPEKAIEMRFVSIGRPGNEADVNFHGQGRYGAVKRAYQVGVDQVTHLHYAQFLNAIAGVSDPHGLYHPSMAEGPGAILRTGTRVTGFRYLVKAGESAVPMTGVTWYDAVRYCNWVHQGRPVGAQSPATTEDGAYRIEGETVSGRHPRARVFLPREDEWYKAAYFSPDAAEDEYTHFAGGEDDRPLLTKVDADWKSAWGVGGLADETWEWTESPVGSLHRAVRSAAWFAGNNRQAAGHFYVNPQVRDGSLGFRLARPEETLVDEVSLGVSRPLTISLTSPPEGLVVDARLGLLRAEALEGTVVHVAREGVRGLFETRAVRTPADDLLMMFPEGNHYAAGAGKVNDMLAYRSSDDGATWVGPTPAFSIDYSQHGFIPLIPRGGTRIYAFGTQPIPTSYSREQGKFENAPIGYRWSDDDGRTWSQVKLIKPVNDPDFLGMSVTRMCETASGAWIVGAHAADWSKDPLETEQYLLRSEDQGKSWELLPGPRPGGWSVPEFSRMDEGRPIWVGGEEVLMMARTPAGRLWMSRSKDDGRTWPEPEPSNLVHPDAPPMLFHLSDGKTLVAFIHNRHAGTQYTGLSGTMDGMRDRSEIWVVLSDEGGRRWTLPRFLMANATVPDPAKNGWFNHNISYLDAVIEGGVIHLFCPHLWKRALHMALPESALGGLLTVEELRRRLGE